MDRESESRIFADTCMKLGLPNLAAYVLKYGLDAVDPFLSKPTEKDDRFYKKCLEEGHTWDYYYSYSPGDFA